MASGAKSGVGVRLLQMDREGSGGAKLAVVAIEGRESSLPKWRCKSRESAGHWSAWGRRNLKNHKE